MRWQQLFEEIRNRAYGLEEYTSLHADTDDQMLVVSVRPNSFDVSAYRTTNKKNWQTLFSHDYKWTPASNPVADEIMIQAILRAALVQLDTDRLEKGGHSPQKKLEYWMSTGGSRWKKENGRW